MKSGLNASAYQDNLDDAVLPSLWQLFGEGSFLYSYMTVPQCKVGAVGGASKLLHCSLAGLSFVDHFISFAPCTFLLFIIFFCVFSFD